VPAPAPLTAEEGDLQRAGITWVLLPSDQAIAVWDIEVSADDAEAARAIVEGSGAHRPIVPPRPG
jgi:hypothetical protein